MMIHLIGDNTMFMKHSFHKGFYSWENGYRKHENFGMTFMKLRCGLVWLDFS